MTNSDAGGGSPTKIRVEDAVLEEQDSPRGETKVEAQLIKINDQEVTIPAGVRQLSEIISDLLDDPNKFELLTQDDLEAVSDTITEQSDRVDELNESYTADIDQLSDELDELEDRIESIDESLKAVTDLTEQFEDRDKRIADLESTIQDLVDALEDQEIIQIIGGA